MRTRRRKLKGSLIPEADRRASLGGRCLPCLLPCAEERASILTTGADDKRARSQCKGTRLRRSCPCGQTLALPACPHVSRFFVVRIHSRSKDTQENAHDTNQRIELQRTSIRYYGKKIAGQAAER